MSLEIIAQPETAAADIATTISQTEQEPDEILSDLQTYFGPDVIVEGHDEWLRKDYFGPASYKTRCGGALVVNVAVRDRDGVATWHYEIDDNHRPFDNELLITRLGKLAETSWPQKGWVRDYRDDPRL